MAHVEDDSRWDYDCPQYIDFTVPLQFNDGADKLFEQGLIGEGPSVTSQHATLVCEATSHPQNKAENHSPEKQVHLVEETHREEPLEVPKNSSNSSDAKSLEKGKERKPSNLICSLEEWRHPGKHASSGPDESSDKKKPRRSAEKTMQEIAKMAPKMGLQRTWSLRLQKSSSASLLPDVKTSEQTTSAAESKPPRNPVRGLSARRLRSNSITQLKKESEAPKMQKMPQRELLSGPQCLKMPAEGSGSSKVKTTEELELEHIKQMKKELKHKLRLAQESYKKAMTGAPCAVRPAHSSRDLTVPQEFHFHTDARLKSQSNEEKNATEEKTAADFVKSLRSHTLVSSESSTGPKMCTLPQPFHLSEKKAKQEKPATVTKFESTAEKITAFHKRTPERFHVRPRSIEKAKVKRARSNSPAKLTVPRTPNLQNQFKARPVNEKILSNPHCGVKKVPSKPPTEPEEFALSCNLRGRNETKHEEEEDNHYEFHAKPLNKKILEGPVGIKPVQPTLPTVPKSPAFALKNRIRLPLELPEENPEPYQSVKMKPVPHIGIPFQPKLVHQHTIPEPFTVELRSKAMIAQREEKIKQTLEEEKRAREFHAQPLPSLEPGELPPKMAREPTKPEPFMLETDVRGSKYTQEIVQKLKDEEEQKKAMVFKAQPNLIIYKEPFLPAKSTKPLTAVLIKMYTCREEGKEDIAEHAESEKNPGERGECPEWAMIELQGELETRHSVPLSGKTVAPAKRLVLFVADGLRADKFYELDENGNPRALYLRKIIEEEGAWGVSHTRVPTESRPGHVALIAGFYEDVSAVAKGWKENPVEFDSVFNESRFTWSWGSPDILPMFAKDASGNHVVTNCYPPDLEDFAGFNIMQLDTWVFQQVQDFFESSKNNETLRRILHEDKLVFFLHLLGTDTIGHSSKPYSMEYLQNIKLVDAGIQKVVGLIENFYANDRKTTYVMTSDHGMTNWGSHGAGHPHETLTPIVVWGSGIRGPELADSCGNYSDGFCDDWHLQHLARTDIEQADVAPLMAFLLGLHFPVNSVGILPLGYLNASDFEKAEGLYANALEILGQYQVAIVCWLQSFTYSYICFKFALHLHIDYSLQIAESRYVIQTALKGLRYYQTYDRLFLGFSIVVSFIGWMGYILHLLVTEHTAVGLKKRQEKPVYGTSSCSAIHFIFAALGIAVLLLLYIQSVSWTNYCYCLLPVVLWMKFTEGSEVIFIALRQTVQESSFFQICCTVLLTLVGLEIVVMSFFYRELLSLGLLAMACWIFTTPLVRTAKLTSFGWIGSCVLVSIFPLLPVVGGNVNYNLVLSSALVAFVAGVILIWRIHNHRQNETRDRISIMVMCVQLMLVAVATIIVKVTSDSIADKSGLPFIMQTMSWTVLVVSPCLPLLTNTGLQHRLISISLAFVAPYLLMSITYPLVIEPPCSSHTT
ncbi:hypothetical protein C0Q70_18813 [Pomacea canaliculata]|uniref:GPI ethanolamine phosphate transferase 1 n=1 Tax=Pomacea canaliculata TaxID=400727 RepID=A0A2T7NHM4_POMCA|nr:hypothetical protein C0Q70_18813 [Pomacea canaliculata]